MSTVVRLQTAIAHWFTTARLRRWTYFILVIVLAILCLWPRPYMARSRIMPQDTANAAGISSLMGAFGGQQSSVATILGGGRPSNDMYLIIGRSDSVQDKVIRALKLVGPDGYDNADQAKRALERKVEVNMLLGGVMEISAKTWDPEESLRLNHAYIHALSDQLADFGGQLMVNKRRIIDRRFGDVKRVLANSESALLSFRRLNKLPAPEEQLGNELSLRTALQAQLQAKQIELQTLQEFNGPENPAMKSVLSQMATLREQLARTAKPSVSVTGPNLAGSSEISNKYFNLYRDYLLAQALYEIYAKVMEQVALDQLASETANYVQVIDPAFLDIHRQINYIAVALLGVVLLMAAFTELYGPHTGLFNLDAPPKPDGLDE